MSQFGKRPKTIIKCIRSTVEEGKISPNFTIFFFLKKEGGRMLKGFLIANELVKNVSSSLNSNSTQKLCSFIKKKNN